jgi:anti-sigma factor RsiW
MMTEHDLSRIDAYADGALDADGAADVERHLETCPTCAERLQAVRDVSAALRSAPYFPAPDRLRQRMAPTAAAALRRGWLPWAIAMAASLVAAVSWLQPREAPSHEVVTADAVLSSHLRSLVPDRLVDVASSDRNAVASWLASRVDFSPAVPDLSGAGYALAGGRLDYVNGHTAAAVVYRRDDHVINVLIWPTTNPSHGILGREGAGGYRFRYWDDGGKDYWIVSDLAAAEFDAFTSRLHAAVQRGS